MQGRQDDARSILDEIGAVVDLDNEPAAMRVRGLLAHDEGDVRSARGAMARLIELQGAPGRRNGLARAIWYASRLVGVEAAGGADAIREARDRLESAGWTLLIEDPSLPSTPLG